MAGPYIYTKVDDLEGTDKVGSHQCVALIQHYADAPTTPNWTEGAAVRGNLTIAKGTAIATFENGHYLSVRTGNHAAFYLRQDATGIWIMDQWSSNRTKPKVSSRHISFKGKGQNGAYVDPSNNADAFSIID